MNVLKSSLWALVVTLLLLAPAASFADTNCDEGSGPLDPAQPKGMAVQEIIQKFAARETIFQQARNNYTYTQDITVQQLDGNTVPASTAWCRTLPILTKASELKMSPLRRKTR